MRPAKRCSLCGVLLQGLAWAAGAQPEPQFHMHVFAPKSEAEAAQADTPPFAQESRHFNMVVFQDRPAAHRARPSAPAVTVPALREYPRHGGRRKAANDFTVLLATDMGYQQQHLRWAVAAPLGGDPLAKADWDGIDLLRVKGRFDMASPRGLVVRTEASYAWAVGGNGQQSSPGQVSSSGPANDGYAWHASAGLGYRLRFGDPAQVGAALTPLAGYALHRQRFTLQDVRQQNSYDVDWTGPWTGIDASLNWLDNHELFTSGQYHWANYQGTGNWRQLTEVMHPNSFEHDANATGMYGSVGYRYRSPRAWGVSLSMDYQKWQANSGDERFNLANGAVINSKLSDLWLDAIAVNLGINWRF